MDKFTIIHAHHGFNPLNWFLYRQNASYVALEVTTLIQHHMALRPTPSMNTTWLITCKSAALWQCIIAMYHRICTRSHLWCCFQVFLNVPYQQRWYRAHWAGQSSIAINYCLVLFLRFLLTNTSQLSSVSCLMLFYLPLLFVHPLFLGVVRVEDVPGALLGLLPCWRLFQKAIWRSAFLVYICFTHTIH